MKINGKKTFRGLLYRLNERRNLCIAHEKNYTQLGFEQRYQIEALLQTCRIQKEIAQQIGIYPSTICREFRRNTARRGPQQVVVAPEMLGARLLNAMPTNPRQLNSTKAWSKWPFNGFRSINGPLNWLAFGAKKPAFAPLATNVSISEYGRVSMATSERTNPSRDCN